MLELPCTWHCGPVSHTRLDRGAGNFYVTKVPKERVAAINLHRNSNLKVRRVVSIQIQEYRLIKLICSYHHAMIRYAYMWNETSWWNQTVFEAPAPPSAPFTGQREAMWCINHLVPQRPAGSVGSQDEILSSNCASAQVYLKKTWCHVMKLQYLCYCLS